MSEVAGMFRKKPVVINAVQWTGQNVAQVKSFMGASEVRHVVQTNTLMIPTLEGAMLASLGDWIIKGVKGEFYPCRADIFAATYDPVAEAAMRDSRYECSHDVEDSEEEFDSLPELEVVEYKHVVCSPPRPHDP